MKRYHYKVLGAGLTGATIARSLAEMGFGVTVYEAREVPGGNVADSFDSRGNYFQYYGPHIFHTNSEKVFQFLSRFTEWVPYEHKVKGVIPYHMIPEDCRYSIPKDAPLLIPVPFNLDSLHNLFATSPRLERFVKASEDFVGDTGKEQTTFSEITSYLDKNPHLTDLAELVGVIKSVVFETYTKRQWGDHLDYLRTSVLDRVPIRFNRDDRYFTDKYQFQPKFGFSSLVKNLLDHPMIRVVYDYQAKSNDVDHHTVITIPVTSVSTFNEVVSAKHAFKKKVGDDFEEAVKYVFTHFSFTRVNNSIVNSCHEMFPDKGTYNMLGDDPNSPSPFNRTTNLDNLGVTNQSQEVTSFVTEYPKGNYEPDTWEFVHGKFSKSVSFPTHPAATPRSKLFYELLTEQVTMNKKCVFVAGRLGTYQYLNMDQAVAQGLKVATEIFNIHSKEI